MRTIIEKLNPYQIVYDSAELIILIDTITPEKAKYLLEFNTMNRSASERKIGLYGECMKNKSWKINGDSIRISNDKVLLDGQQRLMACVKYKIEFTTLIMLGFDRSIMDTIDLGRPRNLHDVLRISGVPDSNVMAYITRYSFIFEKYGFSFKSLDKFQITIPELHAYYFENEDKLRQILRSMHHLKISPLKSFMPYSKMIVLYIMFSSINEEKALSFLESLAFGDNLSKISPILSFRNLLIQKETKLLNSHRMDFILYFLDVAIKVWNAWLRKVPLESIKFDMNITEITKIERIL